MGHGLVKTSLTGPMVLPIQKMSSIVLNVILKPKYKSISIIFNLIYPPLLVSLGYWSNLPTLHILGSLGNASNLHPKSKVISYLPNHTAVTQLWAISFKHQSIDQIKKISLQMSSFQLKDGRWQGCFSLKRCC